MQRYHLWLAFLALALGAWDVGAQLPGPSLEELCETPGQGPELQALCELEPDEAAAQGDVALESVRVMRRLLEGMLWATQEDAEPEPGGRVFAGGATGSAGLLAGVSYEFPSRLILGGTLGYVAEEADLQTLGKLDSETVNVSVITAFRAPRGNSCYSYVRGVFIYGWQRLDVARTIAQPGQPPQTARASPDGRQLSGSVRGGMGAPMGPFCLRGFGHAHWDEAKIDRYTESGAAGQDLEVFEQRVESLLVKAGLELTCGVSVGKGTALAFQLRIGVLHEFADDQRRITARFANNPSSTFFVTTAPPDRDYFELGVAVQVSSIGGWTAFVGFQEEFERADHQDTGSLRAGIIFRF